MYAQPKGNHVEVYPQALPDALWKCVLRVSLTYMLEMFEGAFLSQIGSRHEYWEEPKGTCALKHVEKLLAASRCSPCFELTGLYFENYVLFDKKGRKKQNCPALLSHMESKFRTQHIPKYPGFYVKLHP